MKKNNIYLNISKNFATNFDYLLDQIKAHTLGAFETLVFETFETRRFWIFFLNQQA